MATKQREDQMDDLIAWLEDLTEDEQAHCKTIPDIADQFLPKFTEGMLFKDVVAAIRDF